jgi:hypothetical protein
MYYNKNMKHIIYSIIIFLCINSSYAQTLPTFRYHKPTPIFNIISTAPSFGYSLRKLNFNYTGFAVRIRRASGGNPEADVAFDIADIVSGNSVVTVTSAGGGLTVGTTMTLGYVYWSESGFLSLFGTIRAAQRLTQHRQLLIINHVWY